MPFAEVKRKITGYMKWKKDTKKEVQNDVNQENTWVSNHLIHLKQGRCIWFKNCLIVH